MDRFKIWMAAALFMFSAVPRAAAAPDLCEREMKQAAAKYRSRSGFSMPSD